uniref:Sushi domain-containing protein n=1 Tax=Fundulus heteroclitus TaxID=8078 RepID=A0A3Q2NP53_FUNHE
PRDRPTKMKGLTSDGRLGIMIEISFQIYIRPHRKRLIVQPYSPCFFSASCPKPDPPANGRRLGRVFGMGHEVHFLCKPGYELIGPRTRVCMDSLKWSGQQPMCRREAYTHIKLKNSIEEQYSSSTASSPSTASPPTSSSVSSSIRPSNCKHFLGSTHCTCDVGFTISGHDNNLCTDIDECHLFPLAQPGRLCIHQCINTPGSFHCVCPTGYTLARDGRSCTDTDECENLSHNCTTNQLCVNTFGGFQCATVECPKMKNATYIRTSPMLTSRDSATSEKSSEPPSRDSAMPRSASRLSGRHSAMVGMASRDPGAPGTVSGSPALSSVPSGMASKMPGGFSASSGIDSTSPV